MIIAIEGVDASGKASQSRLLAERLKGTRFSFPNYDTPTGKLILGHLKKEWNTAGVRSTSEQASLRDAQVFQALMTVNRLEVGASISAAEECGPVIFDRWSASAFVYGKLDGLDVDWLKRIQIPMFEPDVRILLDIPVEESFKRRPERRDRYESDRPFLERVRAEYLRLWGADEKWTTVKGSARGNMFEQTRFGWWVLDGSSSVEETHNRIVKAIWISLFSNAVDVSSLLKNPWTPAAGWNGELDRQHPEDGDK